MKRIIRAFFLYSLILLGLPGSALAADAPLPAGISADEVPLPPPISHKPSERVVPADLSAPRSPLLPYLDYLLDTTGTQDIEEITLQATALEFKPFSLKDLPRASGTCWLRFTIGSLATGQRPSTLLLDIGESVPDKPRLYVPEVNPLTHAIEWREMLPDKRHILLLPEAGSEEKTCYIRLSGLPGPWFAPTLRSPHDAATNWANLARPAAVLTLAIVMLLCLLRAFSERGQWRIWTALFVATSLAHGLLGLPGAEEGHITIGGMASVLMPGIALMLLPHVGRHLLRCKERSRGIDIQLLLLSLVGAFIALLPLIPGFTWTTRFLGVWPLGTLLLVPTVMGAVFLGLPGSKRFLLGCLLPPLFTAIGLLGLKGDAISPNLLAACPLWGIALAALIIATIRSPHAVANGIDEPIDLEHPLDDPSLRLIVANPPDADTPPAAAGSEESSSSSRPAPESSARGEAPVSHSLQMEDALRLPLDQLMREGAALAHCSLPPAVRKYAENMLAQARRLADIISNPTQLQQEQAKKESETTFNLQLLMRQAHDTVAPVAESANIGLAWYMPPHLGHLYKGAAKALLETLCLLLESSVRATRHGAVHLSVRRVPESRNPGHLLFTVTDTGSGVPPRDRSTLALARAWELAGAHKGYLGVECTPSGATIAFTLHLTHVAQTDEEDPVRRDPLVIICAESALDRQSLAHMIFDMRCRVMEARTMEEALQLHKGEPAVLLVLVGRFAMPSVAADVRQFHRMAAEGGLPFSRVMAVTRDNHYWKALGEAGFTHALLEPVEAAALRKTVQEILDAYASWLAAHAPAAPEQQPEPETPVDKDTLPGPAPGMPPLPERFGNRQERDAESPMQIRDLRALPDLLHFAEELAKPVPGQPTTGDTPSNSLTSAAEQATASSAATGESAEFFQSAGFAGPVWSGDEPAQGTSQIQPAEPAVQPQTEQPPSEPVKPLKSSLAQATAEASASEPVAAPAPARQPAAPAERPDTNESNPPAPAPALQPAASIPQPDKPIVSAGEWVGEPMPLGTPAVQSTRTVAAPAPEARQTLPTLATTFDEDGVGEPMPMQAREEPAPATPVAAPESISWPESAEPASAAPAGGTVKEAAAGNPFDDFMNFIAGVANGAAPAPTATPAEAAAGTPAQPAEPGLAPFVPLSMEPQATDATEQPARLALAPEQAASQADTRHAPQTETPSNVRKSVADPAIMRMLEHLDEAMADAQKAYNAGQTTRVGVSAARIAEEAEPFGCRVLARMARCVEQAGRHNDFNALRDLLPELAAAVERNRIAWTQGR